MNLVILERCKDAAERESYLRRTKEFGRTKYGRGSGYGWRPADAAVMMVDGYRYVLLVATAPGQQRRGYADAAMRHAPDLAGAANGDAYTIFIDKSFLAEH
jgi:hypothetical protein